MEQRRKRCRHTGFVVAIVVLGTLLAFSVLMNGMLFLGSASSSRSLGDRAADEFPKLTERWSYGKGETKAVRIAVTGFIGREADDGLFSAPFDRVESVLRQIRAAKNDEAVKAIILEVDSPGGVMTPSDEIYQALEDFKASSSDRKIVVLMRDLAASGAYLIAMAGDWLIAEPTSLVGSIGVIIQSLNWKTMSEKIGITDTTFKSGVNKDTLNPFREVSAEEQALMQELVDEMHEYFLGVVLEGRELDEEALRPIADGRIFTAASALDNQLIDEIGYWDAAVSRTQELLREKNVKIVRYERQSGFLQWLTESRAPSIRLSSLIMEWQTPRFLFLWRP